jgi:hypothetical protein
MDDGRLSKVRLCLNAYSRGNGIRFQCTKDFMQILPESGLFISVIFVTVGIQVD